MNKNEMKAMLSIANKLGWNGKPATEVIETINQMVMNQQSLELDCYEGCDDFEETLLSMNLWSIDKIISCLYCYDYDSFTSWNWFCEQMNIDGMTAHTLMVLYDQMHNGLAEEYEFQDYQHCMDIEYYPEMCRYYNICAIGF